MCHSLLPVFGQEQLRSDVAPSEVAPIYHYSDMLIAIPTLGYLWLYK